MSRSYLRGPCIPKFLQVVLVASIFQFLAFSAAAQLPELAAPTALTGNPTAARFFGGATADEGQSYVTSIAGHQRVDVHLEIQVDPDHIGTIGNLYVVVEMGGSLFMRDESGTYLSWDRSMPSLLPTVSNKYLQGAELLTILDDIALGRHGAAGQTVNIFLAYDTDVNPGELYYNSAPLCISVVPTNIAYNGWSTMNNTLEDKNTSGSFNPRSFDDPSLYAMVGAMYEANGIAGYDYDFAFLPQGSQYIDGDIALENIYTTTSSVAIISAYGGTSGIIEDPESANGADGWINKMINVAAVAAGRNIIPIMFQAWGEANNFAMFGNAKLNSDSLQERYNILVVRTGEIVAALGQINPNYIINTMSPNGKYSAPVIHLFSGGYQDEFHGSYAMAYANALATFKVLTGISAADNQFVIPSGGLVGAQYGMSGTLIYDVIATVDAIQKETLLSH